MVSKADRVLVSSTNIRDEGVLYRYGCNKYFKWHDFSINMVYKFRFGGCILQMHYCLQRAHINRSKCLILTLIHLKSVYFIFYLCEYVDWSFICIYAITLIPLSLATCSGFLSPCCNIYPNNFPSVAYVEIQICPPTVSYIFTDLSDVCRVSDQNIHCCALLLEVIIRVFYGAESSYLFHNADVTYIRIGSCL